MHTLLLFLDIFVTLFVNHGAFAAPEWPSPFDELEDIMFLNTGYRARGFPDSITPCGSSPDGMGRHAAAEWLRAAFHDASAVGQTKGVGGMDASLLFELTGFAGADNVGPGFNSTLAHLAPFYSSRASMADLLALGVYTSVRACGGPVVQVRTGRIDAKARGPGGVPAPQNSIASFRSQFARMGFTTDAEMIQLVACGHTIGGVHAADFPIIVKAGTQPGDMAAFDQSSATFDQKGAVEYVNGTSTNPLLVGECNKSGRCSDRAVFQSSPDNNTTMKAMTDPAKFKATCATVLQKMIEVVPSGVSLTDPITVYDVKPADLQLSLLDGGNMMNFTGQVRILTTGQSPQEIIKVQLEYKDRSGSPCNGCTIDAILAGTAAGFDDTFSFFRFSSTISSGSSISSFNVVVIHSGGGTHVYNNGGPGYPVNDGILMQPSQSCVLQGTSSGDNATLTIVAAIRSSIVSTPRIDLTLPVPRDPIPAPILSTQNASMTAMYTVGEYNLFSASFSVPNSQRSLGRLNIVNGPASNNFLSTSDLGSVCRQLSANTTTSSSVSTIPSQTSWILNMTTSMSNTVSPTASVTSVPYSYEGCFVDSGNPRILVGDFKAASNQTIQNCAAFCTKYQYFGIEYGSECFCSNRNTGTLGSEADCTLPCSGNRAGQSDVCGGPNRMSIYKNLQHQPLVTAAIADYNYAGCFNDALVPRALGGPSTSNDNMTAEMCSTFCGGTNYFGLEYGRECYCAESLNTTSTQQDEFDCSMACAGNSTELCGAGSRLSLYHKPTTSAGYTYLGCMTDSVGQRVLQGNYKGSDTMTHEECEGFCSGFVYYGLEYSKECFCGNTFANPSTKAPEADCSMTAAGNSSQVAGGPNRLTVFQNKNIILPPTTGGSNPAIAGYQYSGCYTDSVELRVLTDGSLFDSAAMTVEKCATFCSPSKYFGLEYGGECWCGSAFTNPTSVAADLDCSFRCTGSAQEFCGAGNRLTLYTKST